MQGLPALQALQLVALKADMVLDLGLARSKELSHLALACRAFRLLPAGGQSTSDEDFQSMHVLTRVRINVAGPADSMYVVRHFGHTFVAFSTCV